jgi:hypothetical protein
MPKTLAIKSANGHPLRSAAVRMRLPSSAEHRNTWAKIQTQEPAMQKKSLVSTLKTTNKANIAKEKFATATNDGASTRKTATYNKATSTES